MNSNLPPNSDPRRGFFDLFKRHWDAGTGMDPKSRGPVAGWSYRLFADAIARQCKSAPDPDTVAAWLKGTRWPKQSRKDMILAAFFPAGRCDEAEKKDVADAWTWAKRQRP